jgi:hypothetical protein
MLNIHMINAKFVVSDLIYIFGVEKNIWSFVVCQIFFKLTYLIF